MTKEPGKKVLKGVSRSFYLSLRLLPKEMQRAASLGYLLARSSDTIADAASVSLELRRQALAQFRHALAADGPAPRWPLALLNGVTDYRERHLLEESEELLTQLSHLPRGEAALVKEVVEIIISGQELDLEQFADATPARAVPLKDGDALEGYAWRVAGCVGSFWTKLGFQTLGTRFSEADPAVLEQQGIAYGKGLQLVNILRDLPADLAMGRCYLPVADPADRKELIRCHSHWLARAQHLIANGEEYADALRLRRLRAASRLPALLARETLQRMQGISWVALSSRVKVKRPRVYLLMIQSLR